MLEHARFFTSHRKQKRAECGKCMELHGGTLHRKKHILGGDTAHTFLIGGTKTYTGRGDTTHILFIEGTFWVGTLRNIERMK